MRGDVLELAITGEGITPAAVPIKALAQVLSAASSAIEAAAETLLVPATVASLIEVRTGSAAYRIELPGAPRESSPVHLVYEAARARGAGYPKPLRKALQDLHDAGAVGAGIRLSVLGATPQPPILLASVVDEEVAPYLEEVDEVYGLVVAIALGREGPNVRLKLDGRTLTFRADNDVAEQAAHLWNHPVRARVIFRRNALGDEEALTIEEIEHHETGDFFNVIEDLRRDIKESGVIINSDDWLEAAGD